MNKWQILLDVGMLAIIAVIVFVAVKQGFVKSFFRYMKMTIVIIITILIGAHLVGVCQTYIVNDFIEGKVTAVLVDKAEQSDEVFNFETLADSIPETMKKFVPMNKIENYFDSLGGTNVQIAEKVGAKIEDFAIDVLSKIIAYFGTFVLVYILCTVGVALLEKWCGNAPVLKGLNKIFGFAWGVSHAYVVVSLLVCIAILIFSGDFIEGTFLTRLIYKYGLFTH